MNFHQGPVFIDGEFNQDEFHEVRPKSVAVLENIYAVRQLILQDRHVGYREIETTLYRVQIDIFIVLIYVY